MKQREKHEMVEQILDCEMDGWDFADLYEFAREHLEEKYNNLTETELIEKHLEWVGEES